MADWMIYLLKVSCFHSVLILFYLLFLRKLTFYRFNRVFLLVIIIAGVLLPMVKYQTLPVREANQEMANLIATKIDQSAGLVVEHVISNRSLVNWELVVAFCYAIGVMLLFQRYLTNFFKIRKFKYGYQLINRIGAIEVFRTPFAQPFSFFKSVFIPENIEETNDIDLIMEHELQHVNLGHSYDRMLVDFIVVLFWFNPFIYLLRKSLIEVHEYEVDAAVASDGHVKIHYQMSLLKMAGGGFVGPVSFFNFSTIKKRIQMMNQNKSRKSSLISLLVLLPVLVSMVALFSFETKHNTVNPLGQEPLVPAREEATIIGEQPSIFPVVTDAGKVRVSSTFGMRSDPFDKKKKHHFGIDISAETGTPVIATAGGTVEEVEEQPNGYGKYIVIRHDEVYTSKYAQLSAYEVKQGELVKMGQVIGRVGSSGRSTAPHLHYEIRKNGKPVDPVPYISDYKFTQETQLKSRALAEAEAMQKESADRQNINSEKQLTEADYQRMKAERSRLLAEEQVRLAEERKLGNKKNMQLREEERKLAEEQRRLAESQMIKAEKQRDLAVQQEKEQQKLTLNEDVEIIDEVDSEDFDKNKDKNKNKDKQKDKNKQKSKDKHKSKSKD